MSIDEIFDRSEDAFIYNADKVAAYYAKEDKIKKQDFEYLVIYFDREGFVEKYDDVKEVNVPVKLSDGTKIKKTFNARPFTTQSIRDFNAFVTDLRNSGCLLRKYQRQEDGTYEQFQN